MFFDIFKDKTKPSNVVQFPGTIDYPRTPKVDQPKEDSALNTDAHYTIGVNEHGYTQMKIDYTTLTMNDKGVIAMIEDLAHAIRHRYDVEILPIKSIDDN